MKRAEDLREFLRDGIPVEESIDFMPDLPEGLSTDYLSEVASRFPIADNPYSPSSIRDSGLAVWDSVFLPMPKSVSREAKRPKDLSTLRYANSEWERTKEALGMIGRPDGVHYLRPRGEYILDMLNDDIRMLQGAHILAHRTPSQIVEDDYTFGQTSDLFLRSLVKLFLARKFGLKVNVHPESEDQDSFSLYGIEVFGSTDLRAPVLLADPGRNGRLVQDRTVVAVLGSVGIEPHPHVNDKGDWKETYKWSCLPTLVALAGWECVDYVMHSERAELGGALYCAAPCADLRPMSEFPELVRSAANVRGCPTSTKNVMLVDEWLKSEDFSKGLSVTPQLPCPYCIRLNDRAEGVVHRPKCRKPKCRLKDALASTVPEVHEWSVYAMFVKACIGIGRKATAYAIGSLTKAAKRNAAFKMRLGMMKKAYGLRKKYLRKMASGFISEAESINCKIEEIEKELRK